MKLLSWVSVGNSLAIMMMSKSIDKFVRLRLLVPLINFSIAKIKGGNNKTQKL